MNSEDNALVKVANDMVSDALAHSDIESALESSKYVMSIVVTDDDSKRAAIEAMLVLQRGMKAALDGRKPVTSAIRTILSTINAAFDAKTRAIEDSLAYLDAQLKARLRAEAQERERALLEQERVISAAKKAMEDAEKEGREAPPPVIKYVEPVKTSTTTDAGRVSMSHVLKVEIQNPYELPEDLIQLSSDARRWVADKVKRGEIMVKKDGSHQVYRGMRVWYEPVLTKVVG